MWSTISLSEKIPEKYAKLGPGQSETAFRLCAGESLFFNSAGAPKPSQGQSFSSTLLISTCLTSGGKLLSDNCFILRCWYCREAVQIGFSVNSLLEDRNFL